MTGDGRGGAATRSGFRSVVVLTAGRGARFRSTITTLPPKLRQLPDCGPELRAWLAACLEE